MKIAMNCLSINLALIYRFRYSIHRSYGGFTNGSFQYIREVCAVVGCAFKILFVFRTRRD